MTFPRSPPKYPMTSRSFSEREENTEAASPPLPDSAAGIFLGLGDKAGKHSELQDRLSRQQIPFGKRTFPPLLSGAANSFNPLEEENYGIRVCAASLLSVMFPNPEIKRAWIVLPDISGDEKQRENGGKNLLSARKRGHMFCGYKSL